MRQKVHANHYKQKTTLVIPVLKLQTICVQEPG